MTSGSDSAQSIGSSATTGALEAAPPAGDLSLQVAALTVQNYDQPPTAIPTAAHASTTVPPLNPQPIPLLTGSVADMCLYARAERTGWLHSMAHNICDPVNRAGTLWVLDSKNDWREASATDELIPSVYEYRVPPGAVLHLSKWSVRNNKSLTSATGDPADLGRHVDARDQACWITGALESTTTNSHICPKRMGDAMASHIYSQFCGGTANISIFDPIFGFLLLTPLDSLFDIYELGFRQIGHNVSVLVLLEITVPFLTLLAACSVRSS